MQIKKKDCKMVIATKCAPVERLLSDICEVGLQAVELYLSNSILRNRLETIRLCKNYPLRYAIHAPTNASFEMKELAKLAKEISAEVGVFHNIYWEDEWEGIIEQFRAIPARLCIENVYNSTEAIKFERRYNMGLCLDLEHLQIESAGVFKDEFISLIKRASHIHITGFRYGSELWHTPIHHSPEHNKYILGLIKKADYSGFIVSEAQTSLQTKSELKKLFEYFEDWRESIEREDAMQL